MPQAQPPIELTTLLGLQSLFKAAQLVGASKQACSEPESGWTREAPDAVENISDWMAYLPMSCVKAMVNDGWHWST